MVPRVERNYLVTDFLDRSRQIGLAVDVPLLVVRVAGNPVYCRLLLKMRINYDRLFPIVVNQEVVKTVVIPVLFVDAPRKKRERTEQTRLTFSRGLS